MNRHIISGCKISLLAITFTMAGMLGYSATRTASVSGNWNSTATWGGNPLPTSADDVQINNNVTLSAGETYTINSLSISSSVKLTVNGTLTIIGNFFTTTQGNFETGPNAVVIVKGDVNMGNQANISLSSYFIVLGSFLKSGSANQGSLTINSSHIYILGTVTTPYITTFTGCSTYLGTTATINDACDFGTFEALAVNEMSNSNPVIVSLVQSAVELNTTYNANLSSSSNILCINGSVPLTLAESGTISTLRWYRGTTLLSSINNPAKPYLYSADQVGSYSALYKIGSTWYRTNVIAFGSVIAPTATITGSTNVCKDVASPGITFSGSNGTPPYIFTYTVNGGTSQTANSGAGSIIVVNSTTSSVGSYVYYLVRVTDSNTCSQLQSGTATVVVSPLIHTNKITKQ